MAGQLSGVVEKLAYWVLGSGFTRVCHYRRLSVCTCLPHRYGNYGGLPLFNVGIQNRQECRERQSFYPNWESNLGLWVHSPVRYPVEYHFTLAVKNRYMPYTNLNKIPVHAQPVFYHAVWIPCLSCKIKHLVNRSYKLALGSARNQDQSTAILPTEVAWAALLVLLWLDMCWPPWFAFNFLWVQAQDRFLRNRTHFRSMFKFSAEKCNYYLGHVIRTQLKVGAGVIG